MTDDINEAIKYYHINKSLPQDHFCFKTLWGFILFHSQNNIRVTEEVVPLPFLSNICHANNFLHIILCLITLTKETIKQGEMIFFLSDRKFESKYFIGKWEYTRLIWSTWSTEGCSRKGTVIRQLKLYIEIY